VGSTPQREAELAAAWQNWKQIRESFSGPKPSATPAEVSAEPKTKPEQAAPPTAASTEAVAAPAAEVEEAETDAPEESTAIASIVDNMLAELRPKLVAEIAKKMNSDKEKKDKEKKKKR
jgi:hypothetical protein